MFHSLPAALIAAELTFLDLRARTRKLWASAIFNAGAVLLGFMSHLVLDEIWSIDFRHARHQEIVRHGDQTLGRSACVPNLAPTPILAALTFARGSYRSRAG